MIYGEAIMFGLVAMIVALLAGGWLILVLAHAFLKKYHEVKDDLHAQTTKHGTGLSS